MGYYIAIDGAQHGPFDLQELPRRGLRADSLVWSEGMENWQRADSVPSVAALLPKAPPRQPQPQPHPMPVMPMQMQVPLGYNTALPQPPTNGLAVASMVLGIIALPGTFAYCFGVVPAILAIIFGFVGRGKALRGEAGGAGMALAGIVCGFCSLGLAAILILIVVSVISSLH